MVKTLKDVWYPAVFSGYVLDLVLPTPNKYLAALSATQFHEWVVKLRPKASVILFGEFKKSNSLLGR